jgi:hypothetical protein
MAEPELAVILVRRRAISDRLMLGEEETKDGSGCAILEHADADGLPYFERASSGETFWTRAEAIGTSPCMQSPPCMDAGGAAPPPQPTVVDYMRVQCALAKAAGTSLRASARRAPSLMDAGGAVPDLPPSAADYMRGQCALGRQKVGCQSAALARLFQARMAPAAMDNVVQQGLGGV